MALTHLFKPITIAGFEVKNRIVMTPLGGGTGSRKAPFFEERARGGAGMIVIPVGNHGTGVNIYSITVGQPVDADEGFPDAIPPNPATPEGIKFYDERVTPDLREVADACRKYGPLMFAQLVHTGGVRVYDNLSVTVAPSDFRFEEDRQTPHVLDQDEIRELVVAYGQSVRRIREAGIHGAEIHAAHGYLVNQFLSPYTNRRSDRYGGSLENRMRFLVEILDEANRVAGADFPLSVRINGSEEVEGGLTADDMAEIVALLQRRLAYVSVAGGTTFGLRHGVGAGYAASYLTPPMFNLAAAARIKKAIDIPVIVAGRFIDPAEADRVIGEGLVDLVGQAREMLADPHLPTKIKEGRFDEIRPCIGYNECHMMHQSPINMLCAVNPLGTRENQLRPEPAAEPRRVVVVGGGPAGMEAAAMAAARGHSVTLLERTDSLGGQLLVVARQPSQEHVMKFVDFQRRQLELHGVEIRLGVDATADLVASLAPDTVLVATGAEPYTPPIPGIDASHVVNAVQVLKDETEVDGRVVVMAGLHDHVSPLAVADLLAGRGLAVRLVAETIDIAPRVEKRTLNLFLKHLEEKRVELILGTAVVAIERERLAVESVLTRARRYLEGVDQVVVACGGRSVDGLYSELKGRVPHVLALGDALAPRRLIHAVHDGARAGHAI